ncbi:DUF1573 domain-containing protein [Gimesia panareensis]|uniref:DUF1573 domain-containing protein n=1 Tax=Gimesia panareensis TaxID=2527978 RepID=UPI00118882CB|nr:DUF1573 domain-containing protein [Gimesia panareensis]QDU50245.1 hypothetical protein Pan110_25890 [Gimesia panareensis]
MIYRRPASKTHFVFLLATCLLCLGGCQGDASAPVGAALKTTPREFAAKPEEGHVKHRFKIMSVGTAPLEITRVDSSCGCTVAESSTSTIAPGESGFVDADLTVSPNRRESTVYVHTNDPKQSIIVFRISALGMQGAQLAFVPAVLKLQGKPGELLQGKCMLQLSVWKPASTKVKIDELTFQDPTQAISLQTPKSLQLPAKSSQETETQAESAEGDQVALYSYVDRDVFLIPVDYQVQLASEPFKQRFYTSAQIGTTPAAPKALLSVVATVKAD